MRLGQKKKYWLLLLKGKNVKTTVTREVKFIQSILEFLLDDCT